MAYDKHTWSTGEVITAARLNNIEDGIKDHDNNITSIDNSITNILTDIGNLATLGEKYASDFAVKQTSTTASQAFAVGEFLTLAGQLYRVTNAIASGEELAVGTNIEASNVGAELVSLKNSITTLNDSLTNVSSSVNSLIFPNTLIRNIDLNDYKTSGVYYCAGGLTNKPGGNNYGALIVYGNGSDFARQTFYPVSEGQNIYSRAYYNSSWSSWFRFTGVS